MSRRRAVRALSASALIGTACAWGPLVGEGVAQGRGGANPGPIWLEMQATREELETVMAIARRLNARLGDDAFLAGIARASSERRYDDLADMVADAAGVSPGWVKAGPGEVGDRIGSSGEGVHAAGGAVLAATPPATPPATPLAGVSPVVGTADAPGLRAPWYLRYQSRSWAWCITTGSCPP